MLADHLKWQERELVPQALLGSQSQPKPSDVCQMMFVDVVVLRFLHRPSMIYDLQKICPCFLKTFVRRSFFGGFLIHRGYRLMSVSRRGEVCRY